MTISLVLYCWWISTLRSLIYRRQGLYLKQRSEMATDLVLSIVSKIGEYLVAPVGRQFGYLIFYDRNIKNLETEVQNLEDIRDGILRKVDEGKRKNETVEKVVERWLGEVDNLSEEAKKFLEDDVKANKGCLNGWCPNLKSRYSLSRKATKKTQGLVEKCVKGTSFTTVTNPTPLGELVYKPNRDYRDFKSRELIVDKVMEALRSDDLKKVEKFDIMIGEPYPRGDRNDQSSTDLHYYFSHFQNRLVFRNIDVSHLMETMLKKLLKGIRVLKLDRVKGSMNILSGLGRDDFPKLKKLKIRDCGDLEYLINTTVWVSHTASAGLGLEKLTLVGLPALTHVWKDPTQLGSTLLACFHNLTRVEVEDCPKLKSMFSVSLARHLIQLRSIRIWDCEEMEVIVSSEGGEHEIVPAADKIVFPKVHTLHLISLRSFTALCKDMIAIEMPELETLFLWKMPKLQYIWCPPESNHNSVIQSLFHNKKEKECMIFNSFLIWNHQVPLH
ncbi:hypothetical protein U1Q18_007845 [Sarracenia purpurea var. burkii]